MKRIAHSTALMLAAMVLAACNTAPKHDPAYAPVDISAMPPKPEGNGAIYQAGYERSWFEDRRARRLGDILTVNLVEQVDGTHSNEGALDKSSSTTITNPTLLGSEFSFHAGALALGGMNPGKSRDLTTSLSSNSAFSGSADNSQSSELTGTVTVMVTEVLPNGYLRIRGEKRIGMTGGNEYVKLSGIVRPEDIDTTNTIDSTKIADATLIYKGDGQISQASVMGWLAKFFISSLMPF